MKSAISTSWPSQKPVRLVDRLLPGPSGKRRRWTRADQLLVDEANSMLNGTPFSYGHVVVDEAQDHSAVALAVIGRRSPTRSLTLVGDVAQSTSPAGQERWGDVFSHLGALGADGSVADLTIGYRVPGPILDVANRLLPLTGVTAEPSRSVRTVGIPPRWSVVEPPELADAVAAEVLALKRRHPLTGVVAPVGSHDLVREAVRSVGLLPADHLHDLDGEEVPLFGPETVKGLEFDGVVVVNPHEILGDPSATVTPRGARLLYVAMTRAVQELTFVTAAPPPPVVAPTDL